VANDLPIIIVSRVTLQRIGGGIATPERTLWAASVAPPGDEGALNKVDGISQRLEDYAGQITGGNFSIYAMTTRCDDWLHSMPGGILYGLTNSIYVLATVYVLQGGHETPILVGRVEEWSVSHMEGQTILTCDGGLAIWKHITDAEFALANPILIGRPFKWLVDQVASRLPAVQGIIELPSIVYDEFRLSFAEHPDWYLADGDVTHITPTSHVYALATDGTNIFTVVERRVLRYDPLDKSWHYLGALTGMIALAGMGYRVMCLQYEAGPQLRALVEHVPVSITTGYSPDIDHTEVYEIVFNITTGASTLIRTWNQHNHERIPSVPLRYTCSGSGGFAYASAEAVGCVIPAVPDQTYADTRRPTDSTLTWLPVGSKILPNGIQVNGIGLGIDEGAGIIVYADGRCHYLGYATGVTEIGGIWTWIETYVPPNFSYDVTIAFTDALFYYCSWSQAAMPSPNVYIGYPTMVDIEYSPAALWGGNPRAIAPVKVKRRNGAYMGGVAGHISLSTDLELPALLEPGWYAFISQTENWADHPAPSTDQTESDTAPFVITFERPRYICDFANGWTQRDNAHITPPATWDHRYGRSKSYIYYNNIMDSGYRSEGKSYSKDNIYIVTVGMDETFTDHSAWLVNGSDMEAYFLLTPPFDHLAHGNAYAHFEEHHHIAEQQVILTWRDTDGYVAVATDTGNRSAGLAYGISRDWYIPGTVEIQPHDIVTLANEGEVPGNTSTGYYVDTVEPYYGTPGTEPLGFYTLVTVYPQPADYEGEKHVFVLESTRRLGRWLKYEPDWSSYTVLHNCVLDTTRDVDGEAIARQEGNYPPGTQYTVEKDDDGICKITLDGDSLATPTVILKNHSELRVIERDPVATPPVYAVPSDSSTCYYSERCGTNHDETWIIFNPQLEAIEVWVGAQFWGDDYCISDFWEQDGNLYAVEEGTGLILKYDGLAVSIAQDIGRKQTGILAPAQLRDNDESWLTTAPSGYLSKFALTHTGHIDSINPTGGRLVDLLGLAVQAMGMVIWVDGEGKINIKNRTFGQPEDNLDCVRPTPTLRNEPAPDSVRIEFNGGNAQAGKSRDPRSMNVDAIENFAQAQWLADLMQQLDSIEIFNVNIPIDSNVALMDCFNVTYPDPIIDEEKTVVLRVIDITPDFKDQQKKLTLGRVT